MLDDLQNSPVISLPDGTFPKIQHHLKGLGFQRSTVDVVRHEVSRWEGRTEDRVTIGYCAVHAIGNFGVRKVSLSLATGLTVGDSLVVKGCFAVSDYFRQLLLFLAKRAQYLFSTIDDL